MGKGTEWELVAYSTRELKDVGTRVCSVVCVEAKGTDDGRALFRLVVRCARPWLWLGAQVQLASVACAQPFRFYFLRNKRK